MYYYTSSGSYRKSKMSIDFMIIIMAVIIVALFATIIFWQSMRSILFPAIFVSGAIINALSAVKNFINNKKRAGILLTCITIALVILATFCWNVTSRI